MFWLLLYHLYLQIPKGLHFLVDRPLGGDCEWYTIAQNFSTSATELPIPYLGSCILQRSCYSVLSRKGFLLSTDPILENLILAPVGWQREHWRAEDLDIHVAKLWRVSMHIWCSNFLLLLKAPASLRQFDVRITWDSDIYIAAKHLSAWAQFSHISHHRSLPIGCSLIENSPFHDFGLLLFVLVFSLSVLQFLFRKYKKKRK